MALFKRKDKDTKKGAESAIGKIIYGFLLFMPLVSIGARCLYVIFNKNAYQSYAYTKSIQYELVDNQTNLIADNDYQFTTNADLILNNNRNFVNFTSVSAISGFTDTEKKQIVQTTRFEYYTNQNGRFIHFSNPSTNVHYYISFADSNNVLTRTLQFAFVTTNNLDNPYVENISLIQFGEQNYLDNVFEYSINQVENSNLYNWASETGTYTVLNTTCNQLGITNTFIPLLFTYWLITSVIYFIFDIALILIWMIHNKIHELQESI